MNIAFYTQQEITPYTGGIGRVTSILTEYFRKQYGWKVFSLFAETVPASFSKVEVDGAWQGRLHDRFNLRRGIKGNTRKAAQFIQENRVDVVIVQTSMDVPMRLRLALQAIGYDMKIVTCLHFTPGKDIFLSNWSDTKHRRTFSAGWCKIVLKVALSFLYKPLITQLTKLCYRRAYQYADGVCLLSESYKDEYLQFAGINDRRKFIVMPNPLSFTTVCSESELCNKRPIALVVGRMSEYEKRISVILNLWGRFEGRHPDTKWCLKIVGDGVSLADYKRQSAALGLKKCSFEGVQNPVPYYKESKLFLMTSAFEGFPMTLVEAQQFGCVPIAMNAFSSLPDIVSDRRNGIVVRNEDEAAFLSALEELVSDGSQWEKLARNALKDCQRFSQDSVCGKWKELIERITR